MHFSAFIVVVIIALSHIGKYGMLPTLLCSLLTAVTRTSQQLENMYLACATCENGVKHLMLFGNDQIIYGLAETGNPLNPHLTVCKLLNDLIMLGNLCKNSKIIFSFKSKFPLWPRYGVAFRQPVCRKGHEIFVWSGWGTMHSVQVWLPVFETQRVPLSQITTPHVLCSVYKYN